MTTFRRLLAVGFVIGALAAIAPATGLASNPGGGHRAVSVNR